jgi:hypothetical protein
MDNKIGTDGPGTALPFGPVKHTPWPWSVRFRPGKTYARIDADKWKSLARVVVLMEGATHNSADGEANARLIAAAPDLLEALRMVRDADDDCGRDGLQRIPSPARSRIDAAIAKAVGQGGPTGQARSAVSSNPGPSISSQGGV